MKYFLTQGFAIREDIQKVISNQDYEITKERAFNMYKDKAGPGKLNLMAMPNFNKGAEVFIRSGTVRLWGEDIGESECFRRRLKGSLHTDVLE